jgi:hypothetical protein
MDDFIALIAYTVDEDPATADEPFPIVNKSGIVFPETGGIGRTIFYVAGTLIVLGSVVGLAVYMKMSSVNDRKKLMAKI